MFMGLVVALTLNNHVGAQIADGLDLDGGCRLRHDDPGLTAQLLAGEGDPLCVVASGTAGDALLQEIGRQLCQLVISASELEREDRLQILAFEQHLVTQPLRQVSRWFQRGFNRHVIDPRLEDPL